MGREFLVIDTDTGIPDANFTLGTFMTREEAEAFVEKQTQPQPQKLTKIEAQALQGILDSDYMDGMTEAADVVNHPVWTWSANPFDKQRTFSGAVSSLKRKGLVKSTEEGRDSIISMTQAGFDALTAWKTINPQ